MKYMGLRSHIWQAESSRPLGSIQGDLDVQQTISTDLLATFVRCISRRLLGCLADHVSQSFAPFFSLQPKSLLWQLKSKFCQLGAFGKKIRLKKAPENLFTSYHKHPWVFLELIAFLLWTLNLDFGSAFHSFQDLGGKLWHRTSACLDMQLPWSLYWPSEKGLGREQPGVKRNGATQNRIGEHQA